MPQRMLHCCDSCCVDVVLELKWTSNLRISKNRGVQNLKDLERDKGLPKIDKQKSTNVDDED